MSRLGRHRGRIPPSRVRTEFFPLEGGLNMSDPALTLKAGECLASVNHEPTIPRGYSRVEGYERVDGQPAPSEASYWLLEFKAGVTNTLAPGDVITSYTAGPIPSEIYATVLALPIVLSGTWVGGDAAGYVILGEITYPAAPGDEEFQENDVLTYDSGTDWATVNAPEREAGVESEIVTLTTLPGDNKYITVAFTAGQNEPAVGDFITGVSSATQGTLVSLPIVTSGSWASNDAVGFFILIDFGGAEFRDEESLTYTSTVTVACAEADGEGEVYEDVNSCFYFHYLHLSQETRRSAIQPVPGTGPVRGTWMYNGDRYAFRDKEAPATTAGMYKETPTGWEEQEYGSQLGFTDAFYTDGAPPPVDVLLVGATSGASGTLRRIITTEGAWTEGPPSNLSAGEYVLSDVTGTFVCGEGLIIEGVLAGVAAGPQVDNEFAQGGHYDFINFNFYGSSSYFRMYFVNGVNKGCEWDGTTLAMISTGMEIDTPTHINAHAYQLFFAFRGGSLQHSEPGEPLEWEALYGAGELATGDEITGLVVEASDSMNVFSRNSAHTLYGSGSSEDPFTLKAFHQRVGAIEWSTQKIGQSWFLDDRGLTTLTLTERFGNFNQNSVSMKVEPFLRPRMSQVACSQVSRGKNQYRIFFTDGSSLWGAFDGKKILGFMPVNYSHPPFCAVSVEDENGFEHGLMGGMADENDDAYVYEQDIGTSFDGLEIEASLMVSYYHYKSPSVNKRFRGVVFEIDVADNTDIRFLPDFSYGNEETPRAVEQQNYVVGGGGLWDYALWDNFLWSGQVISVGRNRIDGQGYNMGLMIYSKSRYLQSYNIQGATVSYSLRRLVR